MSNTWAERALAVIPQGANTLSRQHRRYGLGTPPLLIRGARSKVYDEDNAGYYDLCCALGAVTLGHGEPRVQAAVIDAISAQGMGNLYHLPTLCEVEVSERFCEVVRAEQVRWVSSGSEASEGACRIARLATGRTVILSIGYHSWYSTFSAAKPVHPGCPEVFRHVLVDLPYNDLDAVLDALAQHPGDVAALIIEPMALEWPNPGYLQALRTLCTQQGIVLIFDEVITGFRWAIRGGAQYFGVEPDLQIYAKSLTNGMIPAACIVGPRSLMTHAWPVSGTSNGHPLAMAAVDAVLTAYTDTPIVETLWTNGIAVQRALATDDPGVTLKGPAVRPCLLFRDDPDHVLLTLFTQKCAQFGLLWQPAGSNILACWSDDERIEIARILQTALAQTLHARDDGTAARDLLGPPLSASPIRPAPA